MNNQPIGVFDSGVGGLTVVKEIIKELPNESLIYLGDTARVPYGSRGKEVITQFALEMVNFLLNQQVKCLIVACNTISATCLETIKSLSLVPVIGVIDPTIKQIINLTKTGSVGVIGTPATINSQIYAKKIHQQNPGICLTSQSCPLFVPLAEEGLENHPATKLIAQTYLDKFKKDKIDTLILGCTHYPLLKGVIQETVGSKVKLVDSAGPTARFLKQLLKQKNIQSSLKNPQYRFLVTDNPTKALQIANRFFDNHLPVKLEKITLSNPN